MGNTGRVQRVEDDRRRPLPAAAPAGRQNTAAVRPSSGAGRPAQPLKGISAELAKILGKLSPMNLETEDLLLLMVLYLMYRESGDTELLIILGAMLLL